MQNPNLWPALKVERRPLAGLIPYARNARTHSSAQVAQIAASVREWGWTIPVLIDEGGRIIAGHGRVLAAHQLGMADIPVMVARGWTEAQKQAYTLADNKLALNAGWDMDMLRVEFGDLQEQGIELSLLGFDAAEVDAAMRRSTGLTDPDEAPEPPKTPITRPGDVWMFGQHRLVCGDATNEAHVASCLGAVQPELMVTDPPYGVNYDPAWRDKAGEKGLIRYAASNVGLVLNDDRVNWQPAWALFPGAVAYVWHADRFASKIQESLEAVGFEIRSQIIWAKSFFAISRGHYNWQHEPCWYAVRKNKTANWNGTDSETTLWQITKSRITTGHSTQKPIECMRRPIVNSSAVGQAVYDPFVGTGTTIIAAEMLGRSCHAIELNPAYCDVAVERWQAFTGGKAQREGHTPRRRRGRPPKAKGLALPATKPDIAASV